MGVEKGGAIQTAHRQRGEYNGLIDTTRREPRGLWLALALAAGLASGCAHDRGAPPNTAATMTTPSLTDDPGYTPAKTTEPRTTKDLAGVMREDAPQRYVVAPGDTLWSIAARYLRAPWYWRQLWQANPDIDDPDRIYPGDVLVLTRGMDGTPRLSRQARTQRRTVHLSPRVRVASLETAIPTIPAASLRAFLQSPRRVDAARLAAAPYVVAVGDGQLVAGNDALLYIRGLADDAAARYALVRPVRAYSETSDINDLGARAVPVGDAEILATHEPSSSTPADSREPATPIATARFARALREARPGDRLLPISDSTLAQDFQPRTPTTAVQRRIVSVYGGISQIGRYDVVALAATPDTPATALARGDVLEIYQAGDTVIDPVTDDRVRLPERRAGRLMVFDAGPRVSYALIMQAERAIHIGDIARSPAAGA